MLNVNKFYCLLLLVIGVLSHIACNSRTDAHINEKYEIISLLIDKHTVPILIPPPPPPYGVKDTLLKKREFMLKYLNSDEWKNQKQIVAINKKLSDVNAEDIPNHDSNISFEYKSIFDKFFNGVENGFLQIKKINPTRGNIFIEYPNIQTLKDNPKLWETFDLIVSFSDIKFNNDNSKAVVYMGISFGKLNGWNAYFLLEKRKKEWIVKYSRTFQIS